MASKESLKQQLTSNIKENSDQRKIIRVSISKFLTALSNGEIEIKEITDFERLVKLDILLKEEEIKYTRKLNEIS